MASSDVMAAVDARIATYWAVTDPATSAAVPYYGLNEEGETPASGGAFLAVQYPVANAEQKSIGSPGAQVFREEGGIRFVLSIPRGQGTSWWMQQLEALLAHFRAQKFSGVNTWAPTSPVLDDSNDQGAYWRLTAVAPYYFDTLG
jgi:hypothetical protein